MLSVALLPVALPDEYNLLLTHYATFYARLAKEDRMPGGLYQGDRMIPPDAFAVDAQPVFEDYARRYAGQAFAIRIQVTAEGPIPSGISEAIGAAISPGDVTPTHLSGNRASSSYSIRRAKTAYEQDLCRWNLSALDIGLLDGRPEIWERPDPPPLPLAALCALGDARDAACAFRFPVAVDGTVPGFKVRRGHFGHVEQLQTTGPIITLGSFGGGHGSVTLPVDSLNKHALIAGSTGSGKTTTVLEILRQLWVDHHIPFLVIEPVNSDANDYRRLLAEPGFEDAQIWTVGDESVRPLRFNPFRAPPRVLVGEHLANLLNCFKAAFGLWEQLSRFSEMLTDEHPGRSTERVKPQRTNALVSHRPDLSVLPWAPPIGGGSHWRPSSLVRSPGTVCGGQPIADGESQARSLSCRAGAASYQRVLVEAVHGKGHRAVSAAEAPGA